MLSRFSPGNEGVAMGVTAGSGKYARRARAAGALLVTVHPWEPIRIPFAITP